MRTGAPPVRCFDGLPPSGLLHAFRWPLSIRPQLIIVSVAQARGQEQAEVDSLFDLDGTMKE
jgi:hypothetical protein